ncbi:MAG TPA: hypothetical protein VN428_13220 [Bryobacteraceae bacterium]|nr:hypothetical protein [Bryobacteraceae bacterium]
MRRLLSVALFASTLFAAAPITRHSLEPVERGFDKVLSGVDVNDPFDIIGLTRGLYLEGFGVVFTTETNLVISSISPFARTPNKDDITKLRLKKASRLEILRGLMRQQLLAAGTTLQSVPLNEQVVVAVTLFYRAFEQRDGLPDQIIMQAPRQTLMDIKNGRAEETAIRVQEQ